MLLESNYFESCVNTNFSPSVVPYDFPYDVMQVASLRHVVLLKPPVPFGPLHGSVGLQRSTQCAY